MQSKVTQIADIKQLGSFLAEMTEEGAKFSGIIPADKVLVPTLEFIKEGQMKFPIYMVRDGGKSDSDFRFICKECAENGEHNHDHDHESPSISRKNSDGNGNYDTFVKQDSNEDNAHTMHSDMAPDDISPSMKPFWHDMEASAHKNSVKGVFAGVTSDASVGVSVNLNMVSYKELLGLRESLAKLLGNIEEAIRSK